jgi:hypothetical protein
MTEILKPFDFDAPLEAPELNTEPDPMTTAEVAPATTDTGMPTTAPASIPVNTAVVPVTPTP